MNRQSLILSLSKQDQNVVLAVHGELDLSGGPTWTETVLDACTSAAQRVTIDLGSVTFIDSSGLRMLFIARDTAEGLGVHLVLANIPANVARLFQICGLAGHFDDAFRDGQIALSPL